MLTSAPLRLLVLPALVVAATVGALSWHFAGAAPSQAGRPAVHTIEVGDFWFCDQQFQGGVCETVIQAGDSVAWDFGGASATHSATECGASCDNPTDTPFWDSDFVSDGSTFDFSFPTDQPGTYLYRCRIHPTLMRGRIVVQAGLPTPPGPSKSPGDVNCDRDANAIDAALLLQFGAGILDDLECLQNADVNGDGRVDAIDAALVLQFVAGLLDTLPP